MEPYKDEFDKLPEAPRTYFDPNVKVSKIESTKREIFRVIDDSEHVLTTDNPYLALKTLQGLIDKHQVEWCWVDIEEVV